MSTGYVTNLDIVMKSLSLSSRSLSAMLNIHYSLVSKWINGKRVLKHNSVYLKQIVEIMMNFDGTNGGAVLHAILSDAYPNVDFSSSSTVASYLSRFLATDTLPEFQQTDWDKVDKSKIRSRSKLDIYVNASGRQNALFRLLDSALALPSGQIICVYGTESTNWRTAKSIEIQQHELQEKQLEVVNAGNTFEVIHSMDRKDSELLDNLFHWLPIHLTRKTKAYYIPEYSDANVFYSVTLIRRKAAMFGLSVDNAPSGLTTYYTTDNLLTNKLEECFDSCANNSISLFDNPVIKQTTELSLTLSANKSNFFYYCTIPAQYCLDMESFEEVFNQNGITDPERNSALTFIELDQKRLFTLLENKKAHLFISLDELKKALSEGIYITYCNWMLGKNLFIPPEVCRKVMLKLADALEIYPNLFAAFTPASVFPFMPSISLYVKEYTGFLANMASPNVPGPLLSKEPTIVSALYRYFDKLWRSTSKTYRDKESVVEILRSLLTEVP